MSPGNCENRREGRAPPAPEPPPSPGSPRLGRSARAVRVGRGAPRGTTARPRSPHAASAHGARLGVFTVGLDHARLRKGVGESRGARFVGGRGWVPSEVDPACGYVDLRSNDDIVRVHLHGVARQLVAPPGWQALILAARTEGASIHA
eukprot:scaffold8315_cov54-Phaeocystis_antarctica.AAC.3